jgi:hypothetical protein
LDLSGPGGRGDTGDIEGAHRGGVDEFGAEVDGNDCNLFVFPFVIEIRAPLKPPVPTVELPKGKLKNSSAPIVLVVRL